MARDIKELISQVNITELIGNFSKLYKAGASYKTLCNVHGDTSPSLSINPRKQIYKCFVCNHGGNALDYLIWAQRFTYNQAIEYLVNFVGEDLKDFQIKSKINFNEKQIEIVNALKDANNLFRYFLDIYLETNNDVKNFLLERKLTKEEIIKYSIGFAPLQDDSNNSYVDLLIKKGNHPAVLINASLVNENNNNPFFYNRIIFPIFDEESNLVAFGGRKLSNNDSSPKYIHSKESSIFKKSSIIYNYQNASKYEQLIIVEGFMDVIAFNKIGFDNAVAIMGVALTNEHIKKIKKHKEILVFLDNDQAGLQSTLGVIKILLKNKIEAFVINNDLSKDADEIVNSENGKEKLLSLLSNNKISFSDFVYNYFINNFELSNSVNLQKSLQWLKEYTQYLNQISLKLMVDKLAKKTNIDPKNLFNLLNNNSNVIELYENKLNRTNENVKEVELVNIKKILIAMYKNPTFIQFIDRVNWITPKHKKISNQIKEFHESKIEIPQESQDYLKMIENNFNSIVFAQTHEELFELISRCKEDQYNYNKKHATKKVMRSDVSDDEKIVYLENKQEQNLKKIKE